MGQTLMLRWDTFGGCLGIIVMAILAIYAITYLGDCLFTKCP